MRAPWLLPIGLAAALAALAGVAHGNGRPPFTNGVTFQAGDDATIYLRTSFGLLISHDDGCTFRWVCEQNVGYGGTFDPKYVVGHDGTIFATTFNGLRVSRDGGCSFTTATAALPVGAPGRIADIWIDAIDLGPTGEVWVATAESGKPNDIFRSTDGGQTFASRGMLSPTIWWKSVKVAATDPLRVYAAGYQVAGPAPDGGSLPPTAHLLRTDDAGGAWTESPLAGVGFGSTPLVYVSAVDPVHKDLVLMTSVGANPPSGDRIYRSTDGAMTWTEALATTDPVRDVVIRADGSVLLATQLGGSFRSTDGGATFAPLTAPPQLACLGERGDGTLFGCGTNWAPDSLGLGRSTDAASWLKVFRFVNLAGPLACPAGTAEQDTCAGLWPMLRDQFAATGPTCGAYVVDAGVDAPPPARRGGGCCDAGGGPPVAPTALALVLALAAGRRRRG